jgi:four helix bundle protein
MLVAYTVSLDLIRSLRPVVQQLAAHSGEEVKQLVDAASSITRNIAGGSRRSGKDMRRFYWYAHGNAAEVRGTLELARAWGWAVDTEQPLRILDRLIALLWGLTYDRPSARG